MRATTDTTKVILNFNVTKPHDGFILSFDLKVLEKLQMFYV